MSVLVPSRRACLLCGGGQRFPCVCPYPHDFYPTAWWVKASFDRDKLAALIAARG